MNRDLTREIYQRLKVAELRTREAHRKVITGDDLHKGSQIAQNWPFITAGYCGIEQSFKFLIARRKGLTSVRKLLEEETSAKGISPYRTHDLRFFYKKLDPVERSRLSDDYRLFRSPLRIPCKVATCSSAKLPPSPGQSFHPSERSDAGRLESVSG